MRKTTHEWVIMEAFLGPYPSILLGMVEYSDMKMAEIRSYQEPKDPFLWREPPAQTVVCF